MPCKYSAETEAEIVRLYNVRKMSINNIVFRFKKSGKFGYVCAGSIRSCLVRHGIHIDRNRNAGGRIANTPSK